jgi:hypothetical protein
LSCRAISVCNFTARGDVATLACPEGHYFSSPIQAIYGNPKANLQTCTVQVGFCSVDLTAEFSTHCILKDRCAVMVDPDALAVDVGTQKLSSLS